MKRIGRFIVDLLRELSDENAYARYLAREGRTHSACEWRKFYDRRLREKYSQPKCC